MISSPSRYINFEVMKHRNSICQINIDRDREVIRLYQQAKRMVEWPTTTAKICAYVSQMPTQIYYLSFDAAYRYVCNRKKGKVQQFGKFQKMKQSLCEAFFSDYLEVERQAQLQGKHKSVYSLVEATLERPGPHLGIAPTYIRKILSAYFRSHKSPFITR